MCADPTGISHQKFDRQNRKSNKSGGRRGDTFGLSIIGIRVQKDTKMYLDI